MRFPLTQSIRRIAELTQNDLHYAGLTQEIPPSRRADTHNDLPDAEQTEGDLPDAEPEPTHNNFPCTELTQNDFLYAEPTHMRFPLRRADAT